MDTSTFTADTVPDYIAPAPAKPTPKPVKLRMKNVTEDTVVTCSSEDESIASVSADGTITGLKKGCTGINVYVEKNGQICQYRVYVRVK